MNTRPPRRRCAGPARVGIFGLLGSGNLGNDGSLEVLVDHLRGEHPDAVLDVICSGPVQVRIRFGVPTIPLHWSHRENETANNPARIAHKAVAKVIDLFRIAAWVRRHDVVIIPGMGVFETTTPIRPWDLPYSIFLVSASGRLFGTKVAYASVGANFSHGPLTRRLFVTAARLAYYRSFRDEYSREAMRQMGLEVGPDPVYADLAWALPRPPVVPSHRDQVVGVGVMSFFGGNEERQRAGEIHAAYADRMRSFVLWLLDNGNRVRFFTGDASDEPVVARMLADLRDLRPDLASSIDFEPASSLTELMAQMAAVDAVIATRFHNVLIALLCSRPTLSIGYAAKNQVLMTRMGMGDFYLPAQDLDVDRAIRQFGALMDAKEQVTHTLASRHATVRDLAMRQLAELSELIRAVSAPQASGAIR